MANVSISTEILDEVCLEAETLEGWRLIISEPDISGYKENTQRFILQEISTGKFFEAVQVSVHSYDEGRMWWDGFMDKPSVELEEVVPVARVATFWVKPKT